MKVCTKCRSAKPLEQFHNNKTKKDGKGSNCKACHAASSKAFYETNRDHYRAVSKAWREANRERERAASKARYETNREHNLTRNKDWREANRERNLARIKAWREANRERERAASAVWREANRERERAASKAWREANPEKMSASTAKRRAAKLQRTIALSPEHEAELKRIYAEAKHISETTETPHHVDHIVPLQGKEMSGLHVPWNLEVVPARQNLAKSNKVDYSRALPTCTERAHA